MALKINETAEKQSMKMIIEKENVSGEKISEKPAKKNVMWKVEKGEMMKIMQWHQQWKSQKKKWLKWRQLINEIINIERKILKISEIERKNWANGEETKQKRK